MQAVGMIVYVVVRWHVKLHRNLVALEEEIGDKLHFWPVRATVRATDADVIPSLAAGGHDSDRLAIHGRRDHEHSRATVARPAPILHDMAVGSAILIKLVEVSQHLAPLGVNRISIRRSDTAKCADRTRTDHPRGSAANHEPSDLV